MSCPGEKEESGATLAAHLGHGKIGTPADKKRTALRNGVVSTCSGQTTHHVSIGTAVHTEAARTSQRAGWR
jgi:hypothetical protein